MFLAPLLVIMCCWARQSQYVCVKAMQWPGRALYAQAMISSTWLPEDIVTPGCMQRTASGTVCVREFVNWSIELRATACWASRMQPVSKVARRVVIKDSIRVDPGQALHECPAHLASCAGERACSLGVPSCAVTLKTYRES